LPEIIHDLVEGTITRIKHLAIYANPELFDPWVFVTPVEITDITIPPAGQVFPFFGRIVVPLGTPPGTYRFMLQAIGDGYVYGERPVTIVVPPDCQPTRPPFTRWYYLPIIAHNHPGPGAQDAP
jgi:hypothetical protein